MTTHKEIIAAFREKFCSEDLSLEKRGKMVGWFLRDDITAIEAVSFLTDTLTKRDAELVLALESHKKILFEGRESQEVEKHNAVLDLAIKIIHDAQ